MEETKQQNGATEKGNLKCKIFVGGISQNTTNLSLKTYFETFGEVEDTIAIHRGGSSRGFGFVTFVDPETAKKVFEAESHQLNNRVLDCKPARPAASKYNLQEEVKTGKIFVGGISKETTKEEFKDYFETFGTVKESIVMMDRITGKSRGFGFVTFASPTVVNTVLAQQRHTITGKVVECKHAVPKNVMGAQKWNHGYGYGLPYNMPNMRMMPQDMFGGQGAYGMPYGFGGYGGGYQMPNYSGGQAYFNQYNPYGFNPQGPRGMYQAAMAVAGLGHNAPAQISMPGMRGMAYSGQDMRHPGQQQGQQQGQGYNNAQQNINDVTSSLSQINLSGGNSGAPYIPDSEDYDSQQADHHDY